MIPNPKTNPNSTLNGVPYSPLKKLVFHMLVVDASLVFYHLVFQLMEDHIVYHFLQTTMLQMNEVEYLLGSSRPND
jgi:hypothetical protein